MKLFNMNLLKFSHKFCLLPKFKIKLWYDVTIEDRGWKILLESCVKFLITKTYIFVQVYKKRQRHVDKDINYRLIYVFNLMKSFRKAIKQHE